MATLVTFCLLCIWAETHSTVSSTYEQYCDSGWFCYTLFQNRVIIKILWRNLAKYSPASYYLLKSRTIFSSLLLFGETSHNISPASYYLVKPHAIFSSLLIFDETSHNILQAPTIWWNLAQYSPAFYYLVKTHTIFSSLLIFGETSQNILQLPTIWWNLTQYSPAS